MKYLVKYPLLFFAITCFQPAFAQVRDTATKWSIQDCFQYASQHNIQLSTLRLNQALNEQDLIAAKGARIPSLSGSVGNTFNNANNSNGNGGLVNQLTSTANYSVNSAVTLWNGNYINNNIRQKDLLIQSAGLSVQQSQNDITLLITQGFLNILLAKENLQYIADLVTTSTARVAQGQLFYDAGSIAKKDLLQLQAQLASDQFLLVQAQNTIRQNVLNLKQLLQLPTDTLFDVATPDSITVEKAMPDLHAVQQNALQNFPDVKIGNLGLDIAALDIAKAKAGFKPVVSASGAIGSGYDDVLTNSVFPKTGYFTQNGNNFYQRLGVAMTVPIFSNRINKTNLEKANISYRIANLNLQNSTLLLSQAVEQAYLDAVNAQQAYEAANQQLVFATESYRIANEQFKLGAANTYDLLQQRNQYVQAVQAFTQAKYTAVLQQKIYEFYMGTPVVL